MGREIRRVPVDFQHPRVWVERLKHRPMEGPVTRWVEERMGMWDRTLAQAQKEWDEERDEFLASGMPEEVWTQEDLDRFRREYPSQDDIVPGQPKWGTVEEYCGARPTGAGDDGLVCYQPDDWPPEEERGWVVFQTVSEGTPVTPCLATAEDLIDWLSEKGTEWDAPMSREAAEAFVRGGWAASMISSGGRLMSGLESFEPGAMPTRGAE